MPADNLLSIARILLVVLASLTVHEFSHALAADALGDDTPRRQGRLTLNPMAHLDPLGTLMIVMTALSGFGIGWGRPVLVNPVRLRYGPAVGMGIVAVAGPVSNLLLALAAAIGYQASDCRPIFGFDAPCVFFQIVVVVNVGLAVFNLIPLFPLDGFRVALAALRLVRGRSALQLAYRLESTAAYGPMLLLLLIVAGQFLPIDPLGVIVGIPSRIVINLMLGRWF